MDSFDQATNRYTNNAFGPQYRPDLALSRPYAFAPNQVVPAGSVVAAVSTAVNDVQTLTVTGTPTGGSVTLTLTNPLDGETSPLVVPYNGSAAAVQTLVNAIQGFSGNLTVGGGALPGTALTFTGAGAFAGQTIPAAVVATNALTGGSSPAASVAHTTAGVPANVATLYGTALAAPAAPVLTPTGASGTFGAGTYPVALTYATAAGETTPGVPTMTTLTAAQGIQVGALSGLNAAITGVNVYVDGLYAGQIVPSAGSTSATTINGYPASAEKSPPATNTAYAGGAGSAVPIGLSMFDVATDGNGGITRGLAAGTNNYGVLERESPVWTRGVFLASAIPNLDANATAALGRVEGGVLHIN